jgi:hypothetical protein
VFVSTLKVSIFLCLLKSGFVNNSSTKDVASPFWKETNQNTTVSQALLRRRLALYRRTPALNSNNVTCTRFTLTRARTRRLPNAIALAATPRQARYTDTSTSTNTHTRKHRAEGEKLAAARRVDMRALSTRSARKRPSCVLVLGAVLVVAAVTAALNTYTTSYNDADTEAKREARQLAPHAKRGPDRAFVTPSDIQLVGSAASRAVAGRAAVGLPTPHARDEAYSTFLHTRPAWPPWPPRPAAPAAPPSSQNAPLGDTLHAIMASKRKRYSLFERRLNGGAQPSAAWHQEHAEPSYTCVNEERIGPHGDGGKWICAPEKLRSSPTCLVYSVGSNNDFRFEEGLYKLNPVDRKA